MTAKSLADLSTEIDVQLPNNNVGQIHADTIRAVLKDIINNEYVPISNILTLAGTPNDLTYLRGDGTWQTPASGGGGGSGSSYRYVSGTASSTIGDICYCDTSSAGFTLTLPASPVTGSGVSIRDAQGTWSGQNLVLDPGGNKISGVLGTFACDVSDANFDLVWRGSTIGWDPQFIISNFARGAGNTGRGLAAGHATVSAVGNWSGTGAVVVWNSADKSTKISLSGGSLVATASSNDNTNNIVRATTNASALPGYFEVTGAVGNVGFGLANKAFALDGAYLGQGGTNAFGFHRSSYAEGPTWASNVTGGTFINTDIMGLLYDGSQITISKNGTVLQVFDAPTANPSGFPSGIFPAGNINATTGNTLTANFGGSALAHLPTGATSWDGSQTNP